VLVSECASDCYCVAVAVSDCVSEWVSYFLPVLVTEFVSE